MKKQSFFTSFSLLLFLKEGSWNVKAPASSGKALLWFGSDYDVNVRTWLKSGFTKWRLLLLAFLAIYACLLSVNLGYMSIQWDENPHLYGGLLLTRGQPQEYLATYGYYPPLYDLLTTSFFHVFGATATSARIVSVMFSLLSLWIVFEFTNRTYGPRIGLFASVLLSVMPGFFWISRMAILETALIFFFSLALFFFFSWIRLSQNRDLLFCGLVLGVGFLAKYQILIAGLVMIMAILFLCRKKLRQRFYKFLVVPLIAVLVVVPWVLVLYQNNGLEKLTDLLYVVQEGGQDRAVYSSRFPIPIFYLIEVTWPFTDIPVHPISLPLYILGLCGLLLGIYRRRTEDKFFIIWFLVVYIFFTLIPNKQWRYVTPLFPVLAISAANFIYFIYGKIGATWSDAQASSSNHRVRQIAAALTTLLLASAIFFSGYEAYQMTARDQIHVPFEQTTNYLASHMSLNQSAVLVCATNIVSQDMFRFYLPANMSKYQIWQYPALAVDAFTPNFDITEFVDLCQQRNVKYIILFDYGPYMPFFNTTLDYTQVKTMIYNTERFDDPLDRPFFGEFFNNKGYRLFLVRFNG